MKELSLTVGDLWTMRAAMITFGIYCVTFTFRPLIQKVFVDKSLTLLHVLYTQARFFTLMFVGTCCALIYPFYDLMPPSRWFASISFFVGLFSINETYISYTRVPFKLISPKEKRLIIALMINLLVMAIFRLIVDIIMFSFSFSGTDNEGFNLFVRIMRMVATGSFGVSEACVCQITSKLISTPKSELNAEMRLQLKDTKEKLEALSTANFTGAAAAFIDVINNWFELQMTQGVVLAVGSATFIFYGHLFSLGLADVEESANRRSARVSRGTISVEGSNPSSGSGSAPGLTIT